MVGMQAYNILRQNNRFMWSLFLACLAPMGGMLGVLLYLNAISSQLAIVVFLALSFSTLIILRMVRNRLARLLRDITVMPPEEINAATAELGRVHVIEQLIDSLPDPLIFLSADLRIIRANEASHTISNLAWPGRYLNEVFRMPELQNAAKLALESKQPESINLTIHNPVEQKYLARLMPILRSDGDMIGDTPSALLLVLQDLTSQERTERQRSDFIANVSHELRTPLTSVIGFIETLKGPAKDDSAARGKFLDIMQEQSDRMLRLIEDLLSLSKIELDEHTKPNGDVDIAEVIKKVRDTLLHKAQSRNIEINVEASDNLPPIQGDQDQLIQVFQNLIDNAIKYGDANTSVDVTISLGADDYFTISIRDHGDGISEEHLPRLTERFYRIDKARSREVGGTGLGLAIVKHIVNRHRGRINVDSQVGSGTIFNVKLPKSSQN